MGNKVICFDLDDTLAKEIEYLKSAYKEIAYYAVNQCKVSPDKASILTKDAYTKMYSAYLNGDNAFEKLNEFLSIDVPANIYLDLYRSHNPLLKLSEETSTTLTVIKNTGYILGLITDGRSIQQRSKIKAYGLSAFFSDENIIISEEFGSEKPALANFKFFMNRYPLSTEFMYIGDNIKKDFFAPNNLGWNTICLLDNGMNIHKQNFKMSDEYLPKVKITSLKDLLNII